MTYRIAQQKEEEMLELRRERMMKEQRNAANQVNVNTQVVPTAPQVSHDDPVIKLQQMLSADLSSQDEYGAKKQQILDAM